METIESDVTYCSEAEKENQPLRRSKRLSQKSSLGFRLNEDPSFQRFVEIQRILFLDESYKDWSLHDWQALEVEMRCLKPSLSRTVRPRVELVERKIHIGVENARMNLNKTLKKDAEISKNYKFEARRDKASPNILVGMTSDILSELPPYQPRNVPNMYIEPSRVLTQVNALDLTKEVHKNPLMQRDNRLKRKTNSTINTSRPSTKYHSIDLTDSQSQANSVKEASPTHCENSAITSKWLKFITPERTKATFDKQPSPVNEPQNLRESLLKLYKENAKQDQIVRNFSVREERETLLDRIKYKPKKKSSNALRQKAFRNTEHLLGDDLRIIDVPTRNVQSEYNLSPSSDFFIDEIVDQPSLDDNESQATLPSPLKESFKKIFGADSLKDILGCEKILYSLTEPHVQRLSLALKIECGTLKRTIEHILADDDFVALGDDAQSDSSIVQCSQSPPQRLFPSQRSQVSK